MAEPDIKTRNDYTDGSVFKSILKMGLPSMFGFLIHHLYGMVDMYWVSKLSQGEVAVAAITFFNNIMWLFFSFNQLVGPGSVAIISRRYGERNYKLVEKAIKESIILKLFFGLLLGGTGLFFAEDILVIIGARGEALDLGIAYGQIMFTVMPILFATYTIFTAMRGVANPNMALVLMLISNVLNMALDPFFIFGYLGLPAWGIKGAAYASVISYCLTFSLGLFLFYTDRTNVKLNLSGVEKITLSSMWKMVKIGIPAWLSDLSFSGSRLVIVPLIATFGTSVVAAYGVGTQVTSLGVTILVGIGLGLSALIGHNLGGHKYERAKKTADHSILLGVGIMLTMALITFILARFIMSIFFDNPETIAQGVTLLRIFALGFPFIGAFIMMEEIHLGVGLNTPAMILTIIHSWGMQVLPILIVTELLGLGSSAVWWVLSISILVSANIFYQYYRRGKWLTIKL
ncbi:MAG: MATE family efflux transporter [candidate division Zixibacteria bacterium]|nr:MATE family efflux transporter [candidate division Zixibacteria bacterium]MDD5425136.1 MATE family efflux transporter [candidate division Zixibacteria bacterium]